MNKFINRKAQDLNKKILEVEEIERGSDGEITKIVGTLVRADTPETEGTALNAENMNSIIKKMINNTVIEILSSNEENNGVKEKIYEMINEKVLESLTDEDKLQHDKKAITIPTSTITDLQLELVGEFGTTINWIVTSNNATITNNNQLKITQEIYEQIIDLEATFTNGEYTEIKCYSITVEARELTDEEKVAFDIENLEINTDPTTDFYLRTIGDYQTTISWQVIEGDNLVLEGNHAKLIRTTSDTYVTLQAMITSNQEVGYKTFEVLVRALPEFNVTTYSVEWTQVQWSLNNSNLDIEYEEPISVKVNNQYTDMLNIWTTSISENKVRIYIEETYSLNGTSDISSARFYFTLDVVLTNSPKTHIGTISGYVDYYFTSTAPLD